MPDAVLGDQDAGGLGHDRRVHAVELHRPDPLPRVELQHAQGLGVPLDQPAGGDHLADVEPGALLPAELPVRRVGDPGHRREHHRGRHLERTQSEGAPQAVGRTATGPSTGSGRIENRHDRPGYLRVTGGSVDQGKLIQRSVRRQT